MNACEFIPKGHKETIKLSAIWKNFTLDTVLTQLLVFKDVSPEDAKYLSDEDWTRIVDDYKLDIFSVCKLKRALRTFKKNQDSHQTVERNVETLVSGHRHPRWRPEQHSRLESNGTEYKKRFCNTKRQFSAECTAE